MADGTEIEWTDATWNPITGCSVVSPGCADCYAMRLAGTRLKHHPSRQGLTTDTKAGPVWNGQVRFNEQWLTQPIEWRTPRFIFPCAHGDLFHENVPDVWIDQVFAVMAVAKRHTFQVLTKRSARMREYLTSDDLNYRISAALGTLLDGDWVWKAGKPHRKRIEELIERFIGHGTDRRGGIVYHDDPMPLPNVWLGVSAEDQRRADERIPDLLNTPAAVRFVSVEPMIGPVNIARWLPGSYECGAECGFRSATAPPAERCNHCGWEGEAAGEFCPECGGQDWTHVCPDCDSNVNTGHPDTPHINWVIVGGESGLNARPMHPDWPRSLLDQCQKARVPFFFKQWGEWAPYQDHCAWYQTARHSLPMLNWNGKAWTNEDLTDMPPDVLRVGKKRAGAMLDGREWREMPGEAAR